MRWCVLVLVLAGCFADEAPLTGGATCQSGSGWWCGFDGVPGLTSHLYYCPTTATPATQALDVGACPSRSCEHGATSGVDHCGGGVSRTHAFGYPGYGWWCGEAFSGGVVGHLYFFDEGWGSDLGACPSGCVIAAMNMPDYCR